MNNSYKGGLPSQTVSVSQSCTHSQNKTPLTGDAIQRSARNCTSCRPAGSVYVIGAGTACGAFGAPPSPFSLAAAAAPSLPLRGFNAAVTHTRYLHYLPPPLYHATAADALCSRTFPVNPNNIPCWVLGNENRKIEQRVFCGRSRKVHNTSACAVCFSA